MVSKKTDDLAHKAEVTPLKISSLDEYLLSQEITDLFLEETKEPR